MILKEKSEAINAGEEVVCNDVHVILTYKNAVEKGKIKNDILTYLFKVKKTITNEFEYCYRVNPITEGHPAVHVLIKTNESLDQEELKKLWGKGIAKVALLDNFDKRAASYYFKTWDSELHQSLHLFILLNAQIANTKYGQ
jgi:hypothetical protein